MVRTRETGNLKQKLGKLRKAGVYAAIAAMVGCSALPAKGATGQTIKGNTPAYVSKAPVLGPADATKVVEVSIWLNLHNRGELDELAKDLYTPGSPSYRHWLNSSEVATRFAPTAAEVKTVMNFFTSHNLKVLSVGPNNFFVRAQGTIKDVQTAFHTSLYNYQVGQKILRANIGDPYIDGDAAPLVRHISGLDSGEFTHPNTTRPTSLAHGQVTATNAVANVVSEASSSFFVSNCFTGAKAETYNYFGAYPTAIYRGNNYYADPTGPGCGYTPPEIQTAYNLKALYKEGFDGAGQTIVILDWCGSPTILNDANAFSARFGLPALTSANFSIIQVPTPSTCAAPDPEINIDVEWAHAIAPGASIDLLVPPSASFQDVNEAEFYAVNYNLGSVLSGSYSSAELYTSTSELDTENLISEIAAITGISTNFSSGDYGDDTAGGLFPPATVGAPADSPFATSIGGVSLALNGDNTVKWQAGWGNYVTQLTSEGYVFDPPLQYGFYGGSGGGESGYFAKPAFQKSLPGTYRQQPDVSWLADPFTGGVIAITSPGQYPPLTYQVYGGTSLACPMFSALWAIANQEAGTPLGQAAPYMYTMPKGTITDILPISSATNVLGTVHESATTSTYYNPNAVMGIGGGSFYSAFWDYPFDSDTTYVVSFGNDYPLTVTKGWDNVTGVGTPTGKAFADAFKAAPAVVK